MKTCGILISYTKVIEKGENHEEKRYLKPKLSQPQFLAVASMKV